MAEANLHDTIQFSIARRNQLQYEISELQSRKLLSTYSQGDLNSLLSSEKISVRDYFKELYENDTELQEQYLDYTEIPDFEEEIDRITAQYQDQIEELTAWETAIDAQITTADTELQEINKYIESYKSMLSGNIQEDYKFGLNG